MANPFRAAAKRLAGSPRASGAYAGAASHRLLYDFVMGTFSANSALRYALDTLRQRSRQLVNNNSTASRVPQLFSENVMGKDGIVYQAAVKAGDGRFDKAVNQLLEDAWYAWADSKDATVDRSMTWWDLQTLRVENEVTDGEIFLRHVRGFKNRWGYAVQLLDPDQVDTSYNVARLPNGGDVVMGVERDGWGAAVAYYVFGAHPSDGGRARKHERIDAREIIHHFVVRRPGQARGIPWMTPGLIDFQMHGGYRDAELVAARSASAKQGFFQRDDASEEGPEPDVDEDGRPAVGLEAAPGVLDVLPRGWKFVGYDPQHPSTAFNDFDKAIIRSLAVGVRTSYMSLSGDLSDTTYGSGRIGLLAEQRVYKTLQQRDIRCVERPVCDTWREMAILSGALRLPTYDAKAYAAGIWHAQPMPWLDPEVDIEVARREVAMGINSLTRICAERGRDLEEVLQERKRDQELVEEYGVPVSLEAKGASAQPTRVRQPQSQPGTGDSPAPSGEDGDDEVIALLSATRRRAQNGRPQRLIRSGA